MFRHFHSVAVLAGKGGVGKTLVSCALAARLSQAFPVTLLDFDLHGPNVLTQFGFQPKFANIENDKVVPPAYRPTLRIYGAEQRGRSEGVGFLADDYTKKEWVLDAFKSMDFKDSKYVVCDLPAGTDEIFRQVMASGLIDSFVVVTNPDDAALQDATKVLRLFEEFKVKKKVAGVVENKAYFACRNCGHQERLTNGQSAREALCETFDVPYLGAIPYLWYPAGSREILNDPVFQNLTERLVLARFKQRRLRRWAG